MKLYLITRADLSIAQQAVQAAHALQEYNVLHPGPVLEWYRASNTIAFLAVPDELALFDLVDVARARGYTTAPFREPDRNDELTAVVLGPEAHRLVRRLPLALSRPSP